MSPLRFARVNMKEISRFYDLFFCIGLHKVPDALTIVPACLDVGAL